MDDAIQIGADGINAEEIVAAIKKRAEERVKRGDYNSDAVLRAERYNLSAIKDSNEFFSRYLRGIHTVVQVDINDWKIVERRASRLAPLLVKFKKTIWSVLRFYTYRLWSQQNRANDLLHTSICLLADRDGEKLTKLEEQLNRIEAAQAKLDERLKALEAKGVK